MQEYSIPTPPIAPKWEIAPIKFLEPVKDIWELEEADRDIAEVSQKALKLNVDISKEIEDLNLLKNDFINVYNDDDTHSINEPHYYYQLFFKYLYCNRIIQKLTRCQIDNKVEEMLANPLFEKKHELIKGTQKWLISKLPGDSICSTKGMFELCLNILLEGEEKINKILTWKIK